MAIGSAGPLFLAGLLLGVAANDPGPCIDVVVAVLHDPGNWPGAMMLNLLMVVLSSVFGAIIAAPANIICGTIMIWLGEHHPAMRMPLIWALVGALMAGIPAFAIIGGATQSMPVVFAFAFTGAGCALAFRRGVRWEAS